MTGQAVTKKWLGNKTAKTNPEKAQLFAKSVERNWKNSWEM